MSLLPFLFSAWLAGMEPHHMLMDQNFGFGLGPEDFRLTPWSDRYDFPLIWQRPALMDYYYRHWADFLRPDGGGKSTITMDKDKFMVTLDVKQYKPEEINVKVVGRVVVVEAKHKENKDEHGSISRQFLRKYCLPHQVDADEVKSSISSDGVLTITAPVKALPESEKREKVIPIAQTGKPAIRVGTEEPKKEKVIPIAQTGKPAIREGTEKPKEEKVIPNEPTEKPAIREDTEKSKEEKVIPNESTEKPAIPEGTEKPKEEKVIPNEPTEKSAIREGTEKSTRNLAETGNMEKEKEVRTKEGEKQDK